MFSATRRIRYSYWKKRRWSVRRSAPCEPPSTSNGANCNDRRLQARLIDDHRGRIGFEDSAGEDDRERLADADGAGARAPPALQRIGRDVLTRRMRRGGNEEQQHERSSFHHGPFNHESTNDETHERDHI